MRCCRVGVALILALVLAACATEAPKPPSTEIFAAGSGLDAAAPVAPDQVAARLAVLARRLSAEGLAPRRAGADSLQIDLADQAFDPDSGQMRPATLLPLARCLAALDGSAAYVVQVIGQAGDADRIGLAGRRAASVAAFLAARGLPPGRVRWSARPAKTSDLVIVYRLLVAGAEVRAWMPVVPAS